MTNRNLHRSITAVFLGAALCGTACAQLFGSFGFGADVFSTRGLDSEKIPSQKCTGFWKTPSFKCEGVKVPAYFARVKGDNRQALVVISPGAGGLDKRHSEYAKYLAENGINAVVLDNWRARGMDRSGGDYEVARIKGGDAVNMAIDAIAAMAQLKNAEEWKDARFGFLGESMGGAAAINVTRPYIEAIVQDKMNLPAFSAVNFDASVGLYASCVDRSDIERFKKIPVLLVSGDKDDVTPPETCERQTKWMNERGGNVTFKVLKDANHDWDAPTPLRQTNYQNTSKCGNVRVGNKFILESNGKEYPGTPEGLNTMKVDCRTFGTLYGHRGNPKVGFDVWLQFLTDHLLSTSPTQAVK
ncbi:alpha/beta hydrolase [Variovorax sp. OAS795]|uniref:dienelactone hydrolase family protein n=1 Tax=Variovorax sp. OAS795 TaxID=3034231 RepID=UPI0033956DE5